MNEDVRKAAERLRRVYGEESQWSVYDGHRDRASMLGSDEMTIAKAYLAEHPADEAIEISEDWLRSVGLRDNRMVIEFMKTNDGRWASRWHGWELPRLKTRGQVRNLCAALGVELKEPANG